MWQLWLKHRLLCALARLSADFSFGVFCLVAIKTEQWIFFFNRKKSSFWCLGFRYCSETICMAEAKPRRWSAICKNVSLLLWITFQSYYFHNLCSKYSYYLYCLYRYATASARSDGMFLLCGGRDSSGAVWAILIKYVIWLNHNCLLHFWEKMGYSFFFGWFEMLKSKVILH